MEEIITQETIDGGVDVAPSSGEGADSRVEGDAQSESIKDVLGKALGKTFKSDESALKAVVDTSKYVGKVGKVLPIVEKLKAVYGNEDNVLKLMEDLTNKPAASEAPKAPEAVAEVQTLKEKMFFLEHPEYKDHAPLIKALGTDPEKVIASEAFKGVYEKLKTVNESQNAKSVIHSNPRIGQATDKQAQAAELRAKGDYSGGAKLAVEAVLDAYER